MKLLTLLYLLNTPLAFADLITIAGDTWCPFNCEKGEKPGYMIEIADKVFSKAGHQVEYVVVPWERALLECKKGKYTSIVGSYGDEFPGLVLTENELGINRDSFFVLKESAWQYKGIESLDKIRFAIIKGYTYGDVIKEYIEKNSNNMKKVVTSYGEDALDENILGTTKKEIDAVLESDYVFWYKTRQQGIEYKFKYAGSIPGEKKVYIAFSPAHPKAQEYSKILSSGVDQLRKSGELAKILSKYRLTDWK